MSEFNNYEKEELIQLVYGNNNEVICKFCLVTSLPTDYERVNTNGDTKYYKVFYKEQFDFCDINNVSLGDSEAVFITPSTRCGMIQQKANARTMNIKVIIYLVQRKLALPYFPRILNQPPAVIVMTTSVFNELQKKITWDDIKIGIHISDNNFKWSSYGTVIITVGIVVITIFLTMIITITYNRIIIDNMMPIDSTNNNPNKYFFILIPIIMIGSLLLVYLFYFIMVWIFIIMFFLISNFCLTSLLALPLEKNNYFSNLKVPFNKFGISVLDFRYIAFFILGLSLSTAWIINRNNLAGLILNNIMGVYVCINVSSTLGIVFVTSRNFKSLLALLTILLLIDAAFVYVPIKNVKPNLSDQILLSSNVSQHLRIKRSSGNSIMESIVTGMVGKSQEELPMRFKIPKVDFDLKASNDTCQRTLYGYSVLGFGDLVVPGLFMVYIITFAIVSKSSVIIYILSTFLGYMGGLILTYIIVIIFEKGQPALVFLLPCIVLPTLLVAVIRREIMSLWNSTWFLRSLNDGFIELQSDSKNAKSLPTKDET